MSYLWRRFHIWTLISLKPVGQSWSNFMCSSIGVGERLHKVLGADWITQMSDRCPLGYLFIYPTGRMSLISGRIRLLILGLLALEWRKFYTFELEYLWGQLANLDQILCVASLGVGKGCIMFWGRLAENFCVHGNKKLSLTYNWENGVSNFSRLLLIRSFLYLLVTRTCIKSRMSSNSAQIEPLTTELAALERLKNFP